MKRFFCFLSSFVIAFSCLCFSVSAKQKVIGYYPTEAAYNAGALYHSFLSDGFEIGKCVYDIENDTRVKNGLFVRDSEGYYRLSESYSQNFAYFSAFVKGYSCPFYYLEFDLTPNGFLQLYSNARNNYSYDPSYASNYLNCRFGGPSSAFSLNLNGSYPRLYLSKSSYTSVNYGVKYLRIYEVNVSGTAGIEKTGDAFGFMFNGLNNVIGYVWSHPVLMLGIALFACGCAFGIYFKLRN